MHGLDHVQDLGTGEASSRFWALRDHFVTRHCPQREKPTIRPAWVGWSWLRGSDSNRRPSGYEPDPQGAGYEPAAASRFACRAARAFTRAWRRRSSTSGSVTRRRGFGAGAGAGAGAVPRRRGAAVSLSARLTRRWSPERVLVACPKFPAPLSFLDALASSRFSSLFSWIRRSTISVRSATSASPDGRGSRVRLRPPAWVDSDRLDRRRRGAGADVTSVVSGVSAVIVAMFVALL